MKRKSNELRTGRTQKTGQSAEATIKARQADVNAFYKAQPTFIVHSTSESEVSKIRNESGKRARQILEQYHANFQTDLDKLNAIKTGLKSKAITHFIELSGTNQSNVAQLLSLSEPTLRKYINESRHLNTGLSEHILELFELYEKGIDTFGSLGEYRNWLSHYNIGIERTPLELLDTITGIRIVMDELVRIDHGVLA